MKLQTIILPLIRFLQDKTVNTIFIEFNDHMRVVVIPVVTNLTPSEIYAYICKEDPFIFKVLDEEISSISVRGVPVSKEDIISGNATDELMRAAPTRESIVVLNLSSSDFLKHHGRP